MQLTFDFDYTYTSKTRVKKKEKRKMHILTYYGDLCVATFDLDELERIKGEMIDAGCSKLNLKYEIREV